MAGVARGTPGRTCRNRVKGLKMANQETQAVKLAIVYYSSTGTVDAMARQAAAAAEAAGADVRLRHVEELAPKDVIDSQEDAWREHVDAVRDEPRATPDDVVWADAALLAPPPASGTWRASSSSSSTRSARSGARVCSPTRRTPVSRQRQTAHGGHESTLLALYNTLHHFGGHPGQPRVHRRDQVRGGHPYGVCTPPGAGRERRRRSAGPNRTRSPTSRRGSSRSPASWCGVAPRPEAISPAAGGARSQRPTAFSSSAFVIDERPLMFFFLASS